MVLLVSSLATAADAPPDGVTEKEVKVGQCASFSGPGAAYGKALNAGLRAAFEEANGKGKIHGRFIKLITADDNFREETTVERVLHLIENDQVFALVGTTGTAPSTAAAIIAERKHVPLMGMMSGSPRLRPEDSRYVFPIRPTWDEEAEVLVEHFVQERKFTKIGITFPNDEYGQAGLAGLEKALRRRRLKAACAVAYPAGTSAVQRALVVVVESAPEAVIVVGTHKSVGAFAKESKKIGFKPVFGALSFVGTENLIKELGADAEGFVISQVIPAPDDIALPPVTEFRSALKKSNPNEPPTFAAFEGYYFGRVFLLTIDRVGPELNREAFVHALDDIMGTLKNGRRVFLTQVMGGIPTTLEAPQK